MDSAHGNWAGNNEMAIVQLWLSHHGRALRNMLREANLQTEVDDTTRCRIAAAKMELARVLEDWTQQSYRIQRYMDVENLREYISIAFAYKESFLATIADAEAFLRRYALLHTGERLPFTGPNSNNLVKPMCNIC